MGRERVLIPLVVVIMIVGAGCVTGTDLGTLEADVNDARRIAFENRKQVRELQDRIGQTGSEDGADLTDIAEAFKNIRSSQADLYRRLNDLEQSFQETTGQAEETGFQNAQNMRVLMERVDALNGQVQNLHARVAGVAAPVRQPATAGPEGLALAAPVAGTTTAPPSPGFTGTPAGREPVGVGEPVGTAPIPLVPPIEPMPVEQPAPGTSPGLPGADTGLSPAEVPEPVGTLGVTPVSLYRRGHELLQEQNYAEARKVFKRFLREFPEHTYAGNAQYWLAETYYAEKNFEDAILAYEDVIRKFKGSDKVAGAMLKQGYSFLSLMDARTAKVLLESVVRKYPDSEEAALARKKLGEIKSSGNPGTR